jgi:hypothetical protein
MGSQKDMLALVMAGVFVIALILGICLLSLALPEGDLDDRDRRGWWPGSRR